jgi:hypothetical protein
MGVAQGTAHVRDSEAYPRRVIEGKWAEGACPAEPVQIRASACCSMVDKHAALEHDGIADAGWQTETAHDSNAMTVHRWLLVVAVQRQFRVTGCRSLAGAVGCVEKGWMPLRRTSMECRDAVFSSGEQRQQALLRCGLSI